MNHNRDDQNANDIWPPELLDLLSELAAASATAVDAGEVVSLAVDRLKRIFETEFAALWLLSPDGRSLHVFDEMQHGDILLFEPGGRADAVVQPTLDRSGHFSAAAESADLLQYVVETAMPLRVDDAAGAAQQFARMKNVRSALAVPLKSRGKTIGVLEIQSQRANAFLPRDEKFLRVVSSQLAGLIVNDYLHDLTHRRTRNLDLIHQVIREVAGLTDISEIAQVAAELTAKRFGFELAMVILISEDGEHLELEGAGGSGSAVITRGMRTPLDLGVVGAVCQDGISRLVNDTSREPLYVPIPGWRGGSEICVPLRDGKSVFGALVVERSGTGAFTGNDLTMLESLAGILSSVIINARSYQQLSIHLRHLQAVRETALDISADLDLDTLLKRVTSRARELVGAKGAELGLVNEQNRTVEIQVSETPWENYLTDLVIPFNHGIAGIMAVHGETLVVDDYRQWPNALRLSNPPPFTAVAGVPLKYKGQVIGTLTISHDEPGRGFDPRDIRMLELLAPQIAVSVRNARLYQELQTLMRAERLAKDRLVRSARLAAVGELAAGVAHELNNPLTTVAGFVELVLDDLPPESRHRPDLELVLKESRRAKDVVRRLLDFSRPGEGFRVRADVNVLVEDVIALLRHLLHTSGIDLKTDLQPDLPWLQVDQDQIKQVLLNLIHNAIQAMPRGGQLYLKTSVRRQNGQPGAAIRIQDTGSGIAPQHIERLFEPFFTTRPPGQGTGLGLSVSYGIITDHGGTIDVKSTLGEGSVFTIWLPIRSNRIVI